MCVFVKPWLAIAGTQTKLEDKRPQVLSIEKSRGDDSRHGWICGAFYAFLLQLGEMNLV